MIERRNALAPTELTRLAELEGVVDRGLHTFVEVGHALLEIREKKLYRQSHATFVAYCRERFGFSDSRGRQLIAAAKTVTAVTEMGLPSPRLSGRRDAWRGSFALRRLALQNGVRRHFRSSSIRSSGGFYPTSPAKRGRASWARSSG